MLIKQFGRQLVPIKQHFPGTHRVSPIAGDKYNAKCVSFPKGSFCTFPGPVGLGLDIYKPGEGSIFLECLPYTHLEAISPSSLFSQHFIQSSTKIIMIFYPLCSYVCACTFSALSAWSCGEQEL